MGDESGIKIDDKPLGGKARWKQIATKFFGLVGTPNWEIAECSPFRQCPRSDSLFQRIEDKFSKATKFLAVTHRPPSTRWIRWTALCSKLKFIAQDDRIHWRLTGRFRGSSTSSDRSNGGPCFYRVCKWLANGKDELIETQCPIRHHLRSRWNLQDKENRICLRFHSSLEFPVLFQSHSSLIPVSFQFHLVLVQAPAPSRSCNAKIAVCRCVEFARLVAWLSRAKSND